LKCFYLQNYNIFPKRQLKFEVRKFARRFAVSVISEGLGHDSELMTQIYIASLDTSAVDRTNDIILSALQQWNGIRNRRDFVEQICKTLGKSCLFECKVTKKLLKRNDCKKKLLNKFYRKEILLSI